jgi:transmembrane sensor
MVPRGSEYQVILSDGTHIHLNADSKIKFPVVFLPKDKVRRVSIIGEAYFEVAHNSEVPFEVLTSNGTVRVYGTKFNVRDYSDEPNATVTLAEGSIGYIVGGLQYMLEPGMQSIYDKATHKVVCRQVDITSFTSWSTGTYEFSGQPLEQIMSQLSRWYNIDYQFADASLKSCTFTGVAFRNTSLVNLLRQIEQTTQIHFTIKNRTIIITK